MPGIWHNNFGVIYKTFLILQAKEGDPSASVVSSTKAEVQKLELPHYTKYLLIAAYLASHNDAKIDKRLFVKNHGKQKKRLQNIRKNAMVSKLLIFRTTFFCKISKYDFNYKDLFALDW